VEAPIVEPSQAMNNRGGDERSYNYNMGTPHAAWL
jgi:hypothetical protein